MEVVDGIRAGQRQWDWSHVGRCRSISRVLGDTQMTPDFTAVQLFSSGYGRARIGQSFWKGLNNGTPRDGSGTLSMQPVGWYSTYAAVVVVVVQLPKAPEDDP